MKSLKIIVAAALAASMLVGCGSTSDDKAIYNFSSEADVTSLDSSVSDDGVSFNAIHAFSEGLMDITAKGGTKLVPAAASSYKVSDDGIVRSIDRYIDRISKNGKHFSQFVSGRVLSPFIASQYEHVKICIKRCEKHILVHEGDDLV